MAKSELCSLSKANITNRRVVGVLSFLDLVWSNGMLIKYSLVITTLSLPEISITEKNFRYYQCMVLLAVCMFVCMLVYTCRVSNFTAI